MSTREQDVAAESLEPSGELEIEKYKVLGQIKIEQYRSLRSELLDDIKTMTQVEIYSIIGLVGFYAWAFNKCFSELPIDLPLFGSFNVPLGRLAPWFIPVLIPIFGWWRNRIHALSIRRIAGYLRLIEAEFAKDGQPIGPKTGWETYVHDIRGNRKFDYRTPLGINPFRAFWVAMVLMIACIAAVGSSVGNLTCKSGHL